MPPLSLGLAIDDRQQFIQRLIDPPHVLTHWESAPYGKIHKYHVCVAKTYLSELELAQMQRIVSAYLDMAELQAMRRIPMTMQDWEERLSGFLKLWDRAILQDAGKASAEVVKCLRRAK